MNLENFLKDCIKDPNLKIYFTSKKLKLCDKIRHLNTKKIGYRIGYRLFHTIIHSQPKTRKNRL